MELLILQKILRHWRKSFFECNQWNSRLYWIFSWSQCRRSCFQRQQQHPKLDPQYRNHKVHLFALLKLCSAYRIQQWIQCCGCSCQKWSPKFEGQIPKCKADYHRAQSRRSSSNSLHSWSQKPVRNYRFDLYIWTAKGRKRRFFLMVPKPTSKYIQISRLRRHSPSSSSFKLWFLTWSPPNLVSKRNANLHNLRARKSIMRELDW